MATRPATSKETTVPPVGRMVKELLNLNADFNYLNTVEVDVDLKLVILTNLKNLKEALEPVTKTEEELTRKHMTTNDAGKPSVKLYEDQQMKVPTEFKKQRDKLLEQVLDVKLTKISKTALREQEVKMGRLSIEFLELLED